MTETIHDTSRARPEPGARRYGTAVIDAEALAHLLDAFTLCAANTLRHVPAACAAYAALRTPTGPPDLPNGEQPRRRVIGFLHGIEGLEYEQWLEQCARLFPELSEDGLWAELSAFFGDLSDIVADGDPDGPPTD